LEEGMNDLLKNHKIYFGEGWKFGKKIGCRKKKKFTPIFEAGCNLKDFSDFIFTLDLGIVTN